MVRPEIAIPCYSPSGMPKQIELYALSIKSHGGNPCLVSEIITSEEFLSSYDGLLIPGGRDIHPSMYGEEVSAYFEPEDGNRISFDRSMLGTALEHNMPVLGICYGMQLINVYFGGSLYQDILSQLPGSSDHSSGCHSISVTPNAVIPSGRYIAGSSHHQAIKRPGRGVEPFAHSIDGITEAIFCSGYLFALGVQWHPERVNDGLSDFLLKSFIKSCIQQRR